MNRFILFFRGVKVEGRDFKRWSGWIESLRRKGVFVDGAPLVRDGKILFGPGKGIRDFRFDPTENASGFAILKADTMEDAIGLCENCPAFEEGGNVTLRPLVEGYGG